MCSAAPSLNVFANTIKFLAQIGIRIYLKAFKAAAFKSGDFLLT